MNSEKQPNEFSKLLKDKNDNDKLVYHGMINKKSTKQNKLFSYFKSLYNDFLLLFALILLFSPLIYLLYITFNTIKGIRFHNNNNEEEKESKRIDLLKVYDEKKLCSSNKRFAILYRNSCSPCGLFSYYIVHLGCIIKFLDEGFIPIIEVESFPNVFNGYNESSTIENPWEMLFNQPCGYTYKQIKNDEKLKKRIKYLECECNDNMPSEKEIYKNKTLINQYHNIANKYMSVKREILNEANMIWEQLFKNSKNVLGVLVRGTDYTTIKPLEHSIPPTAEQAIKDAAKMDKKNKYDYIFLATEDNIIRNKFIKKFNEKLKYLLPEKKIEYDYKEEDYLTKHKDVAGNMQFQKTYLLSMIILSKCTDIITSRTSGAAGAFILSEGFRNELVYYLGEY